MTARARIPAIDQVFEQVAHPLVPEAAPAALDAPASFTRDGQTIRMRALPDDDGRLVFELLDAKDPHG